MKLKTPRLFLISVFFVALGCGKTSDVGDNAHPISALDEYAQPRPETRQPHAVSQQSENSLEEVTDLSPDQTKVYLKNPTQDKEMRQLLDRIRDSGITKFHIMNLQSGSLRDILGVGEKKMLAWNSAGRRLYPTVKAAQDDGFVTWEFNSDSTAAQFLNDKMREEGEKAGYSDDLLFIMWDGLEISINK